jgi:hypothetical protein
MLREGRGESGIAGEEQEGGGHGVPAGRQSVKSHVLKNVSAGEGNKEETGRSRDFIPF